MVRDTCSSPSLGESLHCRMKALEAARKKKTPTKNVKRASKQPRTCYNLHVDNSSSSSSSNDTLDLFNKTLRVTYDLSNKRNNGVEDKDTKIEVENKPKKKMKIEPKKTKMLESHKGEETGKESVSKSAITTDGGLKSDDDDGKVKKRPRFEDIGGLKEVLDRIHDEVIDPLRYGHPELDKRLGVKPSGGILLHGPPGCGKTKLAHAIANEAGVPFYKITPAKVVSGIPGKSEKTIQDLFSEAYKTGPSIVFIDEIDAIASKRGNSQRDIETRIATQLLTCMDEPQILGTPDVDSSSTSFEKIAGYVLVIGATNRPEALDPALRRPGRFDQEIALGIPDENARAEILSLLTRNLELLKDCNLAKIARVTPGFVGADLSELVKKAGKLAKKRIIAIRKCNNEVPDVDWLMQPLEAWTTEGLGIIMSDFEDAVKMVQPSLRREGFSPTPNIKWEDVGGLDFLRREFDEYIVSCIKYPEDYEEFGVGFEQGFLLYGPPGCGKTTIAKAIANEAGANFIHIKGPELLNKYVGETEKAIREIFTRARACSPCILFFDEVEAITTKRGNDGGRVVERLLTQLLIELDGGDKRNCVFVIGATNRPEVMDEAVKRPGRLGKHMYVPLPGPEERELILKALTKRKPISEDVDLVAIGRKKAYENLSGADLARVVCMHRSEVV
ncbi:hypothetical protein C5167_029719 [Papaver somniferum]|nr:hypothetical protein C5167_029719 [Papaver somniferum]